MRILNSLVSLLLVGCSLRAENDYFGFFNKNNDKYYTHSTKFSYYKEELDSHQTFSIGQSIYTPSKKRAEATVEDLKNNRPYTGWLYSEYRLREKEDSTETVYGIQLGCSGRCSYAKETQVTIHKLLGQGYPTWDRNYSLKSEPGVILQGEKLYELYTWSGGIIRNDNHIRFGNIVTDVATGIDLYYGRGIERFIQESITFKRGEERPWSYYLFAELEGRAVAYNHFLEGSLFQDERHTVDPERVVGQLDLGFRIGYGRFKFSYNYTMITEEWDGQDGPFFFGGLEWNL